MPDRGSWSLSRMHPVISQPGLRMEREMMPHVNERAESNRVIDAISSRLARRGIRRGTNQTAEGPWIRIISWLLSGSLMPQSNRSASLSLLRRSAITPRLLPRLHRYLPLLAFCSSSSTQSHQLQSHVAAVRSNCHATNMIAKSNPSSQPNF